MTSSSAKSVSKSRVLIVDDQPLMREGIGRFLDRLEEFEICGEAGDIVAARQQIGALQPDVVIMELSLGSGDTMELLKSCKVEFRELRVLVYTFLDEMLFFERALHAGASGYLMKQEPAECFAEAVRAVAGGDLYVSRRISAWLLRRSLVNHAGPGEATLDRLTDRELHVFRLLGSGLSTRDIALALNLSVKTVEAHREHIKHKLGLANGTSLNRMAAEWVRVIAAPSRGGDA